MVIACYFLLVAWQEILKDFFCVKVNKKLFMGNYPTISYTCYRYLPSRLSLFSSLVLLKEMRTRGDFEISSCRFCVSYKSKELGGRRSPRFPRETPVVESSSDLLWAIISLQIFHKEAPLQLFNGTLNVKVPKKVL